MNLAVSLGLFLPLIGFFILMITSGSIGRKAVGVIACSTILISFLTFVSLVFVYTSQDLGPQRVVLYNWISIGKIQADFALHIDSLSLLMTLIITGVGFLIHVYSNGYMDHEVDFSRFFAFLNLFVFAMLLLVLAANLLLLFVGWEGVGLASYLLIGFWYQKKSAARAAKKAFVVNRIGDCGFLIGLFYIFYLFGTSDMAVISDQAGKMFAIGAPAITVITLLLFVGATGKSAQLPLHVWLPDAMEGPTPVSALIHAATMVTAGVYLIVRLHAVFMLAPLTLNIVGIIGALTALFAALCALGQTDLKRVLAYSTVSQLGYMFLACGAGGFYAAMFHLTTHAFVKALLFLSAGNVVHMLGGTTQMADMGGLRHKLPVTNWLFLIGALALSGVPPLAVFFSKDLILEQEHLAGYHLLFAVGLGTALLTAFYLMRAYFLTFTGANGSAPAAYNKIKEAPAVMVVPVVVLAVLSIGGGLLGFGFGHSTILEKFLLPAVNDKVEIPDITFASLLNFETLLSVCGALIGVAAAAIIYTRFRNRVGSTFEVLKNSFYIDEIYSWLFVQPLKGLSELIAKFVEPKVFDGSIKMTTEATQGFASVLQHVQSGQLRSYVAWMAIGMTLLLVYFVF